MLSSLNQKLSRALRATGHALDTLGRALESSPAVESFQPKLTAIPYKGVKPSVATTLVAPDAAVIGRVTVGENTAIFNGAVLRGDVSTISVGRNVCIGDRAVVHVASAPREQPTIIADDVLIGTGAIVHGCQIGAGAVIGAGAQVMDGATVGAGAYITPGSVVTPGKAVGANAVWSGVPAKFVREVTATEKAQFAQTRVEDLAIAKSQNEEINKNILQLAQEDYDYNQMENRHEEYFLRQTPEVLENILGRVQGYEVPGRIFNSAISGNRYPLNHGKILLEQQK